MRFAMLVASISLAVPATASDFLLAFPADCTLGQNCYIQQYPDADPTQGAHDYTCGTLVYDGHKGTDIALPTLQALSENIRVLAAAPGRVLGTRNTMPDALLGSPDAPDLAGRDCGNGLVIDHGNGWHTQYCHLREGSVIVRSGEDVKTGEPLGIIGISGRTEFPHLHMSVRKDGNSIDPFAPNGIAPNGTTECGTAAERTLWADPPAYVAGGWIGAGFASDVPRFADIKAGTAQTELTGDPSAMVIWGFGYGSKSGDTLQIEIKGPSGVVHAHQTQLERTQAQMFRASGLRRPALGWQPGIYTGTLTWRRNGSIVDTTTRRITLP